MAASFLPLIGPLPGGHRFRPCGAKLSGTRRRSTPYPPPQKLAIRDRDTIQLATLQVMVSMCVARSWLDPEMASVLGMFRRAANVLARLEDSLVFRS